MKAPQYQHAINASQVLLTDYPILLTRKDTTHRDVLEMMREKQIPQRLEIIDFVIPLLEERGIKVWR